MADVDLQGTVAEGRAIATTDVVFGADPAVDDAAAAFKTDTLAQVIATIFQNPPGALTTAQQMALRTLIGCNLYDITPVGNIYIAVATASPPARPGANSASSDGTMVTAAPPGWLLTRPEATAVLPHVFDAHVYYETVDSVVTVLIGTPNRTDRYIASGSGGSPAYYPVPDSGGWRKRERHHADDGESLSSLTGGDLFFFNSAATNTGATTIDVDTIGTLPIRRSNYREAGGVANTGSEALDGGEITGNDPIMVVYGATFNEFYLLPSRAGTAAYRNIGESEYDVPALGSGGVLDEDRIPEGLAKINPSGGATDRAETIEVGGTVYTLPDDVEDVTDTGLPPLTADNYTRLFIDHDTPRVWVGHREIAAATPAEGDFAQYMDAAFFGVETGASLPSGITDGQFYYWTRAHDFRDHSGESISFRSRFPAGDWAR